MSGWVGDHRVFDPLATEGRASRTLRNDRPEHRDDHRTRPQQHHRFHRLTVRKDPTTGHTRSPSALLILSSRPITSSQPFAQWTSTRLLESVRWDVPRLEPVRRWSLLRNRSGVCAITRWIANAVIVSTATRSRTLVAMIIQRRMPRVSGVDAPAFELEEVREHHRQNACSRPSPPLLSFCPQLDQPCPVIWSRLCRER